MFSDIAIKTTNLSKCYNIYSKPRDRLLQMLYGSKKKYYKEFWALRNVDIEIRMGETIGIVGRNGSGKSTLLQLICGTLNQTAGDIITNGRIAALLELGSGFNPEFTGRENIYMNASILGLSKKEIDAAYDEIVAFADIGDFIDQPVKMYSSGMYVRLAFAVVINVQPTILIVDEALAVGDARFQAKCYKKIKEMKENGVTILFVTHDVGIIKQLCDRAIWIEKGEIVLHGGVTEVSSKYVSFIFNNEVPDLPHGEYIGEVHDSHTSAPINHWGTDIGSIISAGIYDVAGDRLNIIDGNSPIVVKIKFKMPESVAYGHLSAGFSFRSLSGTDLIVSSSCEYEVVFDKDNLGNVYEVKYRLNNMLNAGRYMLVSMLEDRSSGSPTYYEYIEGVQYFSVVLKKQRYGLVCANEHIEFSCHNVDEDC